MKGHNYATAGYYFVTVCSKNRVELFSTISNGIITLSAIGTIIEEEWLRSATIRSEIELDTFVIMPNHVHALVRLSTTTERAHKKGLERHSLSSLIAGFKSSVTKRVRESNLLDSSPWQGGYHDRIVRDEEELNRIRKYIMNNPSQWETDPERLHSLLMRMQEHI